MRSAGRYCRISEIRSAVYYKEESAPAAGFGKGQTVKQEKRSRQAERVSAVAVAVNLLLFVMKLVTGRSMGAMSVIADAYNNLSDAATAAVGLLGFVLAVRPADREHPYGHARYEYLAALLVSAGQLTVSIGLISSSFSRILSPRPVELMGRAWIVLGIAIVVKLLLAAFNLAADRRLQSGTLRAAALDSLSDAGATAAVLVGGALSRRYSLPLDGYMGLAIGCLIFAGALSLCRETITSLLGGIPSAADIGMLEKDILEGREVLGVHDLQIHDYGPGHRYASAHVELPAALSSLESHAILDEIERRVAAETEISLVLHCDPVLTEDEKLPVIADALRRTAEKMDTRITLHDIRVVPVGGAEQVRFDCVTPFGLKLTQAEAEERFTAGLKEQVGGNYVCLPLVEHSFTGEG